MKKQEVRETVIKKGLFGFKIELTAKELAELVLLLQEQPDEFFAKVKAAKI
jgi:hypothetical protein